MKKEAPKKDKFFSLVGKYLGVDSEKIFLLGNVKNGVVHIGGPVPTESIKFPFPFPFPRPPFPPYPPRFPELPWEFDYCFTLVLETPPPAFICQALQSEYDELEAQFQALVDDGLWEQVAMIAARLEELRQEIDRTCKPMRRVIRYCIFPVD